MNTHQNINILKGELTKMADKITNNTEMRASVAYLINAVNNMCNATEEADINAAFIEAKNELAALFKFKTKKDRNKKL